jgi:hypothetical protein
MTYFDNKNMKLKIEQGHAISNIDHSKFTVCNSL